MAFTSVANLTEALYTSLRYFLYNDSDINVSTVYIANPDINISSLTTPFIIVRPWDWRNSYWVMEDTERLHEFYFDLWIACSSFDQQQSLPQLVRKKIEAATATGEDGNTRPGIQIYTAFDVSSTGAGGPNVSTNICEADLLLSAERTFEVTTPEEENRRYMSIMTGYWDKAKTKSKDFIST